MKRVSMILGLVAIPNMINEHVVIWAFSDLPLNNESGQKCLSFFLFLPILKILRGIEKILEEKCYLFACLFSFSENNFR